MVTNFNKHHYILGMRVDVTSIDSSVEYIQQWANLGMSKYVCVSNVHMCMEAYDNPEFRKFVNSADLVVPDGKPLALGLKMLGYKDAEQVRGADLTRRLLELANKRKLVVGLYGGTEKAVNDITNIIKRDYPSINLGCAISPPFREINKQEDTSFVDNINKSKVQILLVGLGCPKQEKWMAQHKGELNAVMVGVGAVFDFLSGTKKEAPVWIQRVGLEWLFRLVSEPRRLWRRYLYYNPRYLWNFFKQYSSSRFRKA